MKKVSVEQKGALFIPDVSEDGKKTLELIKEIAAETPAVGAAARLIKKAFALSDSLDREKARLFADECSHVIADLNYYILSLKDENTRLKAALRRQ